MSLAGYLRPRRVSPPWQLWSLLLAAALLFTGFAAQGVFVPGDAAIARAVQRLHAFEPLRPLSEALYHFGLAPVWPAVTVVVAAALWLAGRPLAGAFVVCTGLLRPLSLLLKEIVERPRPTEDLLPFIEGAAGYSFPSGHVFGTVLLVGAIAYVLQEREARAGRRWLIGGVALSTIVLMGLQRVYAGAHWPTDAVAGWLWGGLILFAMVQAYRWADAHAQGTTGAVRDYAGADGVPARSHPERISRVQTDAIAVESQHAEIPRPDGPT